MDNRNHRQKVHKEFKKINKQDEDSDYEDDINVIFAEDRDKFIGEFEADDYIVIRGYLDGQSKCLRLYYTRFEPKEQKLASLCIIHGFGEYSGRFLQIAETFVKNGFVVHLIDLRGFGYSGGPRGTATIEKMHQDIGTMLRQVQTDLPLFLYGHSLGGLLTLSIVQRNPHIKFAGVVATSSLLSMPKDRANRNIKNFVVRLIGDKLEDIVINSLVNVSALSKVNQEIKKNFTDRLMIPFLGMNMAKSIVEGTLYCLPNAETFPAPVFLLHGQLDAVTDYKDSVEFIQKCQQPNKKLHIFEEGYHELQHDKEREQLKEMAVAWCKEQLVNAQPVGIITNINYGVIVEPIFSRKRIFVFGSVIMLLFMMFVKKSFQSSPNLSKYIVGIFGPMILIKMLKYMKKRKHEQKQQHQQ